MQCNFLLKAKQVPGKSNGIGESLSRQQIGHFRQLAPNTNITQWRCWRANTDGKVLSITAFK